MANYSRTLVYYMLRNLKAQNLLTSVHMFDMYDKKFLDQIKCK